MILIFDAKKQKGSRLWIIIVVRKKLKKYSFTRKIKHENILFSRDLLLTEFTNQKRL